METNELVHDANLLFAARAAAEKYMLVATL